MSSLKTLLLCFMAVAPPLAMPARAACATPSSFASGCSSGGGYSYIFSPGQNTASSIKGNFWALGNGNPLIGSGVDNGSFPTTEWLHPYLGSFYLAGYWSQDSRIDGCIQDPPVARPAKMLVSLSDPDAASHKAFYVLACAQETAAANFPICDGQDFSLVLIPRPLITRVSPAGGTDLEIEVTGPPLQDILPGVHTDGTCGPETELLLGYRVYIQSRPLGGPPPSDLGRSAGWMPATNAVPLGQSAIFTVASSSDRAIDVTVSIVFDSGFETEYVSGSFAYCPQGTDQDGDGYCGFPNPGDDCNDSDPGAYPGAVEVCNGADDDCDSEYDEDDLGVDSDGDGARNACDNCPTVYNSGQFDYDNDGLGNSCDNCIGVVNPGQEDLDNDGQGDVCDACTDRDGDGYGDPDFPANTCPVDNCPAATNPNQADADSDGVGDGCDSCTDPDGDGRGTPGFPASTCPSDNCPSVANQDQTDSDLDGAGDACDSCTDTDHDGFGNPSFPHNTCPLDNCPTISNPPQYDTDADGRGDACDNCPNDSNPTQMDLDRDGVGNACDNCQQDFNPTQNDTDGDGFGDACDNCPFDFNADQEDFDVDKFGDLCDNCPVDYNPSQADFDHDGEGDRCDLDDGLVVQYRENSEYIHWQADAGFSSWNVYEGDLDVLTSTGSYTQAPGSNPFAERHCGRTVPFLQDLDNPPLGKTVFALVTGVQDGTEGGLGSDSSGNPRPNTNPCLP